MEMGVRSLVNMIWIKNEKMTNNQLFPEGFEKPGALFYSKP
ncbi:hypothetical protein SAMN05443144_101257 [Fodinibius roseus]|uniref:Uncharacterized protein n=1 Tax=Fodinibius roseus TaxID=1194090 RepID=A0A1M4TBP8_9BACT|nr:hypothetical protein SAMN05443144_101257 [Fodinibius roseus]